AEDLLQLFYDFNRLFEVENIEILNGIVSDYTLMTLALLYVQVKAASGYADQAELLLRRLHDTQKGIIRTGHPQILRALHVLVSLCKNQSRFPETAALQEEIVGVMSNLYGREHPDTLACTFTLAATYMDQSRFQEAARLQSEGLKLRQVRLGPNHPDTVESRVWLAFSMFRQGHPEGFKMFEHACMLYERRLGTHHPKTLPWLGRLSIAYGKAGRLPELLSLQRRVYHGAKREFGMKHPSTLHWMRGVSDTYAQLGKINDSIDILNSLLELQKETFGDVSVEVFNTLVTLAHSYSQAREKELSDSTLQSARVIFAEISDKMENDMLFKLSMTLFSLLDCDQRENEGIDRKIAIEAAKYQELLEQHYARNVNNQLGS
ncbi:10150_t:CDS:1, partial [Acaulospora colombiana]